MFFIVKCVVVWLKIDCEDFSMVLLSLVGLLISFYLFLTEYNNSGLAVFYSIAIIYCGYVCYFSTKLIFDDIKIQIKNKNNYTTVNFVKKEKILPLASIVVNE
jgi:uncharacterized membrane protein YhdT